jgi:hypothetical protein
LEAEADSDAGVEFVNAMDDGDDAALRPTVAAAASPAIMGFPSPSAAAQAWGEVSQT